MAYTYIDICNEVLKGMNEVTFDNVAEFDGAIGFHAHVKDKMNTAIDETLNTEDNHWPFQFSTLTQTLVVGDNDYALDATIVVVDWDSFYIDYNSLITASPEAKKLKYISWENYRENHLITDLNSTDSNHYNKPDFVTRTEDNTFIVTPKPDYAYTLKYKGFVKPTPLTASTDVPVVPQQFKQVIVDRGMHYVALFRDNFEQAQILDAKWKQGVKDMRRSLIPYPDTMRSV